MGTVDFETCNRNIWSIVTGSETDTFLGGSESWIRALLEIPRYPFQIINTDRKWLPETPGIETYAMAVSHRLNT